MTKTIEKFNFEFVIKVSEVNYYSKSSGLTDSFEEAKRFKHRQTANRKIKQFKKEFPKVDFRTQRVKVTTTYELEE